MANSFSPSYLLKRPSGYYFRIRVPDSVSKLLRRKELRYALPCRLRSDASKLAVRLAFAAGELFRMLEGVTVIPSDQQIQQMLDIHLRDILKEYEDQRLHASHKTREDLEDEAFVNDSFLSECKEKLATCNYRDVERNVDSLLSHNNMSLPKDDVAYKKLCREMLKIQIKAMEIEASRMHGDYTSHTTGISYAPAHAEEQGILISEVIKKYITEQTLSERWTEKSKSENTAIYNLFVRIIHDIPCTLISHKTIREYKETIQNLPANLNKKREFKDKSIEQIIAMEGIQPMAINTINKNLTRISSLFNWAEKHGYISKNYAERLTLKKTKRADEERQKYEVDELQKIFSSDIYTKGEFKNPYYFWLPLIGLFTGARLNELCQLHLDDIRQENDVWVFDINANTESKRLKTKAAKRLVPIHPQLITAGLLEYSDSLRKKGEERLFPELKNRRDGYGQDASKWFGRHREKLGISGKDFHSFRHTLSNNLREQGVSLEDIADIVGHSNTSTTARYTKRLSVATCHSIIKMVHFNIDLVEIKYHD